MSNSDKEKYYQSLMDQVNDKKQFSGFNNIFITKITKGYAEGEMVITEASKNSLGGVHGGALSTLADTVAGTAVASFGEPCVTVNNTINYLRHVQGDRITCCATVSKPGKTIMFTDIVIYDCENRLIATGMFAFFKVQAANQKNQS